MSDIVVDPLMRKKTNTGIRMGKDKIGFNVIAFIWVTFFGIVCLLPFVMILSGSMTAERSIFVDGYRIIPKDISFEAYGILFKSPDSLLRAYGVTATLTLVGCALGLFLTSMTSYVLFRKDFPWRNQFAFFFFFTTLFSGGLVPWYILIVRYLNLKDNPLILLLPGLFSVWYILIMRNFMKSIPDSLLESAKMDGANDFRMYINIVLPLSVPALATIGLFISLGYWNEWFNTLLFIDTESFYPLQYYLHRVLNSMNFAVQAAQHANIPLPQMPSEGFKLVMTVAATGPIIFAYPFVQRYFIRGITIGAVKG
ncbi:MAG: carbohydrate ABC transporter permease [Oscillospiraceae bacterium]|nr:carbohydrate ABC transporter permease [Oscillospiraceae bacterium]